MRYYLTQRPPTPGTFPGRPTKIEAYDQKTYVEEIGREAWGWIEYPEPLEEKRAEDYELTPAP